jgi:hypothetical protein
MIPTFNSLINSIKRINHYAFTPLLSIDQTSIQFSTKTPNFHARELLFRGKQQPSYITDSQILSMQLQPLCRRLPVRWSIHLSK